MEMLINLTIAPLEDRTKIKVYQKCLLPKLDSLKKYSGNWVKCTIHNENDEHVSDVICQIYTQTSSQLPSHYAYLDKTVTSNIGPKSNKQQLMNQVERLYCFTTLKEVKVDAIEVFFVLNKEFFNKPRKNWSRQLLKSTARILLQAFHLNSDCKVQTKELNQYGIEAINVKAKNSDENSMYCITEQTDIKIRDVYLNSANLTNQIEFYEIGFETSIRALTNLIERSKNKETRTCLNALIVGPIGSGKSAMISYVVRQQHCNYFRIQLSDILGQYPGESESKMREIFALAQNFVERLQPKAPTIIHIEELHLLCGAVKTGSKDACATLRLSAQLCSLLDELRLSNTGIICLATTTDAKLLHGNLLCPGRFQCEIEIEFLNEESRKQLFQLMFNAHFIKPELAQNTLKTIVANTAGYVAADLALLVRSVEQARLHEHVIDMHALVIEVLKKSKPTSLRQAGVTVIRSDKGFDSIGGMTDLKNLLKLNVLTGIMKAEAYKRFGLSLPKGILLYGPPGCAKTTIAKCLASEAGMTFIATSGAEVYSPYVGCAEKFVTKLFDTARKHAPCLLFLDEIDTLVGCRTTDNSSNSSNDVQTRILSTLLTEMDGIMHTRVAAEAYILVVAATNRPNMIDDALLRPGRFDQLIHVTAPDFNSRLSILNLYKDRMPFANDVNLTDLADSTQNYSGADICNLCNEAALHTFQRDFNAEQITNADFESVLLKLRPSLTQRQIDSYFEFLKFRLS